MSSYYDDNFGWYNIEDEDDISFYHKMQTESVLKICDGCGRTVKLRPQYGYCNSCANAMDLGLDIGGEG